MTPKLSQAVAAVEKLPQARQDALADLLLDAIAVGDGEEPQELLALRDALAEGEASGAAAPFDFDAFLAERRGGGL